MAINKLLTVIISFFIIIFHQTIALPTETLTNAADTLSNSGYVAMSLTLTLVSNLLLSNHNSATIFSPPDSIFSNHGQPPLTTLQLHFSPMTFSPHSLRSLPYSTKIPTVRSNSFLTITTPSPSDQISINNVTIIGSPIFDDGSLIVYGIDSFFNPNFTLVNSPIPTVALDHCKTSSFRDISTNNDNYLFRDSANVLISRGYSIMASFLNMQLLGFGTTVGSSNKVRLTVLAPSDEVMVEYSGRIPEYRSLLYRHVLPCKVSWRDLINVEDGTRFVTYLEGFSVGVNRSGGGFRVNEVAITFPDMFYSEWIVVHGVRDVLLVPVDEVVSDGDGDGDGDGDSDGDGDVVDEPLEKSLGRELIASGPDRSEF